MHDKLFMPTHPSSSFSHAHTRTHYQPDSSPPGLAQWACYKGLSVWVQSRLDTCPKDTYIHTYIEAQLLIAYFPKLQITFLLKMRMWSSLSFECG